MKFFSFTKLFLWKFADKDVKIYAKAMSGADEADEKMRCEVREKGMRPV